MSDLLRPIIIDANNLHVGPVDSNFDILDSHTGIMQRRKAAKLFLQPAIWRRNANGTRTSIINFENPFFTTQEKEDFFKMQSIIKSCATNAEDIKDALLDISSLISGRDLGEGLNPDLITMDFTQLKEYFFEKFKKDSLQNQVQFYPSNHATRKQFRKDFQSFVEDRNIYTHGTLHLLSTNDKYIIEYIDSKRKNKVFAEVNLDILKSYNSFYFLLDRFLSSYRELVYKRNK